ncbi:phosphotransferase family protein [Butyrivibrio sp. JL13D10]|uniref:phosphotransferase family protein n=1 Tax=Butyrivibrio sp. JL13D10 TaxID=3236815 RepID=UPI0038B456D4
MGEKEISNDNIKKEKPMREISIEGCELIGKGGNGAVYRLDDETIVKVYFSTRASKEKIDRNREITKKAFVNGIPTMIAFDMVKVGDDYGVVYEMINAKSLGQEIVEHPDRIDDLAQMIADTLKKLHNTEFEYGTLPSSKERFRNDVRLTEEAGFYKPNEVERLNRLIDEIPERNTFIHQDFHPGNLMLQNDEIVLIDVDDSGLGHPILDLAAMYLVYVSAAKTQWKTTQMGLTGKQFARIWDVILKRYFGTTSASEIAEIDRIIGGYQYISLIKGVATSPSVPNFLRLPVVALTKLKLFKVIDTLYPIP